MSGFRGHDLVKEQVRDQSDIVRVIGESVELRKSGASYTGLCPFHAEKTPSFSVNPAKQFFHCFGCGESGDVFSFMMKHHRLSFPEALKELAGRAGIDLPERILSPADQELLRQRQQLFAVNEAAAAVYHKLLVNSPLSVSARSYLKGRGIPEEFWEKYRLGYCPHPDNGGWDYLISRLLRQGFSGADMETAGLAVAGERGRRYDRFRDRVLFPILDINSKVVAFSGRIIGEGKPKYMNSPETAIFDKSRLLFGMGQHKEVLRKKRVGLVVEGNFDLLSLAVCGIEFVVAPLGTSLTRHHVRSLRSYCDRVVLLFDGDTAGMKAAMRSVPFFLSEQVDGLVAILPDGHDPDSLIREQGADGITTLIDKASGLAEFVFDTLAKQHGLTLAGKNKIIAELQPLLESGDSQQQALMGAHFSEKLGIPSSQLRLKGGVAASFTKPAIRGEGLPSDFASLSVRGRQLLDFLILYPQFADELIKQGLTVVVNEQPLLDFVVFLEENSERERCTPEDIYAGLTSEGDRRYVAELFMRAGGEGDILGGMEPRRKCDGFLSWLRQKRAFVEGVILSNQIREVEQAGEQRKRDELIERKNESGKKKHGFL
jgi:DNA primase